MKKTLESRIRLQAVLVYLLVAAICCGMIIYVNDLRNNINTQKEHLEEYHGMLSLANEIIYSVNQAQSNANLYITSKQLRHLRKFQNEVKDIGLMIDSLTIISADTATIDMLSEINSLLNDKGKIIQRLNNQFDSYNPLETLTERLRTYEPPVITDTIFVSTVISDTIISTTPKKKFWQRLSDVFAPNKSPDTLMTVTTMHTDTLQLAQPDTIPMISEVSSYAEEASIQYSKRITSIERQVSNLITTDQEISAQITGLVGEFYRRVMESTLDEIEKSEAYIKQNYTFSLIGGIASLFLILILIILIISDVNKGHRARQALEQAHEKIQQVMESRHKLLLSVSHDIKTPLNSIMGYLELRSTNKSLSEKEIYSMQNSGRHINSLLENLLKFSNLEQGTLKISESSFNLMDLCREINEMFTPLAIQKNISYISELDFDSTLWVSSDPLKIKQILTNIISNAIKYTYIGEVRFHVRYINERIHCDIIDTGAGMPAEELENIWKPFTRIERNNVLAEGHGFGMFVVKGLIDLLQGSISIQSSEGRGTEICFTIPATQTFIATPTRKGEKILVIDDDATIATLLKEMLQRLGNTVTLCTPESFIKGDFSYKNFDCIITDMEMGVISGKDILQKVKTQTPSFPVIIMTGRGDYDQTNASNDGFNGYLAKPFNMYTLTSLLKQERKSGYNLSSLEEFYEEDKEAIKEILDTFITSTKENIDSLKSYVAKDLFRETQALCHKMLPMFMQLEAEETVRILKRMDSSREKSEDDYINWKEDTLQVIKLSENLIKQIENTN